MRRMVLMLVTVVFGCGGTAGTVSKDGGGDARDAAEAGHLVDVPSSLPDVPGDVADTFEWLPDDAADLSPTECTGTYGCAAPCTENSDCDSGYCVEHIGQGICAQPCTEECPAGFHCTQLASAAPDLVFVCVSDFATLCKPCHSASDCQVYGDDAGCIDYGPEGAFCGGLCETDGDCPEDFVCQDSTTIDGAAARECVRSEGVCPCTDYAISLQLWSACETTNEFGTCDGKRVCTDSGLAPCDASVPIAETCNGVDDDCDGDIDEATCDDGNPCTDDLCGEDGCTNTPVTGGSCDDDDVCTVADHCNEGTCVGTPVLCNDDNPCTDDLCDAAGGCEFVANQSSCDDNDPCTVGDQCSQEACAGTPVDCECLVDADCIALDDGDLCTGVLLCNSDVVPHKCELAEETVVSCPQPSGPHAFCLAAVCAPDTGACGIVSANDGFACNDGDACTQGDVCSEGLCAGHVPTNCNDGNPCTDDACDPATGCVNGPNSLPCNDGDVCTTQDLCTAGICVGGPALVCDDGNVCNGTESCAPESGCLAGEALFCDDADPCNGSETCDPVAGCTSGQPPVCNDNNPCTADACTPGVGCQFTADDSLPCDDLNACTLSDHCKMGACTYGSLLSCDDDNVCTSDSCDPTTGCLQLLNTSPCNDNNLCTITDACQLGECVGTGQLPCNDNNPCTDDSCDPLLGCQFVPNDGACDDQNACTLVDTCANGQCVGTSPPDCDDGNVCTLDLCDSLSGCTHGPLAGDCDDGDPCTVGDTCQAGACQPGPGTFDCDDDNPCTDDSCQAGIGCVHTANVAPCDDGNVCTVGDSCADAACQPGPGSLDCTDGDGCTTDSCAPLTGCAHAPAENGTECDDGNVCTGNDKCLNTVCIGDVESGCGEPADCTDNPLPEGNTLALTGTINGTVLDTDPILFVTPGATLSGTLSLALDITDEGTPLPLAMIPGWLPHDTGYSAITEDPPIGASAHNVPIALQAPDEPGTYHLWFAATWTSETAAAVSATDPAFSEPVWNNGMDVAGWSAAQAAAARADGQVCAHWLNEGGLSSKSYLARVVTVVVDPIQNDLKVSFTGATSIPGGYPYYLLNDQVTIGDVREGPLDGAYDDYEVPWCNSWGCCDSPSYDAYSISRNMVEPGKQYVIKLTGGDVGPAWLDGYIEVTPPWKVLSVAGSIGNDNQGANYVQEDTKVTFHGGLSYGGCVCPDCGRLNLEVTVGRELAK